MLKTAIKLKKIKKKCIFFSFNENDNYKDTNFLHLSFFSTEIKSVRKSLMFLLYITSMQTSKSCSAKIEFIFRRPYMGKTTIRPGNVIKGGMPSTTGNKSGKNRGNNPKSTKK